MPKTLSGFFSVKLMWKFQKQHGYFVQSSVSLSDKGTPGSFITLTWLLLTPEMHLMIVVFSSPFQSCDWGTSGEISGEIGKKCHNQRRPRVRPASFTSMEWNLFWRSNLVGILRDISSNFIFCCNRISIELALGFPKSWILNFSQLNRDASTDRI